PTYGATVGDTRRKGQLLTVRAVAEILQVPTSWIYEHTRRKCADRIPSFRLGKYLRFVEADITAWLAEKRIKDYHRA
ncbi:MAG: helix-turn-helix domain-containing protein, partial [Candidatus Acidiferrales bacterium]